MLVSAGVVNKWMLTGGRYRGFEWSFWQPNPIILKVADISEQLGPVVLHELLHAQGADHVLGNP